MSTSVKEFSVLVYSHRDSVIEQIRSAIGTHPAEDVSLEYYSATDYDDIVAALDKYSIDLVIFDGEAQPMGGLGAVRQMRDETERPPKSAVVVARDADQWLGAWSGADAVLTHPLDPIGTARRITDLLLS
ncbi:response regulator [Salininema proteolyticum]|uniref:Response regulatory domain-containing protein n=1 Tax=Salininema proteolyticum TaxID=1607685 RepID=A0ABV8TYJ4_9ACTN